MRSLKYLLTVISLVSVLSANAQIFDKEWGKQPVVQMRSTSAMAYSGSTLPMAAATGVTMVSGSVPSANAPAGEIWSVVMKSPSKARTRAFSIGAGATGSRLMPSKYGAART